MKNTTSYRILLVEDDENLGFVVNDLLEMEGYQVRWVTDGEAGSKTFQDFQPHLSVLDIMLPKKDGYTLGEEIKVASPQSPLIFLTARGMEADRVKGFQAGAEDYITKPFSNQEFLLRVKAILARCYPDSDMKAQNTYHIGEFEFEPVNLLLKHQSENKQLTQKESDVLKLLCQSMGDTVKRELILSSVWGNADYFTGRSLDVFISKLRKYLKADENIQIENVHGVGFRLRVS
ncbi:MAG: response regulator transcription factor [Flavobacteriales bacterium]|nr:response regulator transcription factor [Flavobacteriales bacterium]MCB9204584.1 response regulator transcription factor [Flavobacteriales bacterium]